MESYTCRQQGGKHPEDEDLRLTLKDLDGNLLSSAPLLQSFGPDLVTFSNGTTVARVPPRGRFTSDLITSTGPSNAPDVVRVTARVDEVGYKSGIPDEVTVDGPSSSLEMRS